MGLSQVNKELRYIGVPWAQCDLTHAIMRHTNNPSKNYCTVEFKIPSLSLQLKYIDDIEDTYHYDNMHRMKYDKSTNTMFHSMLKRENTIKLHKKNRDYTYTYYMSTSRRLGLLRHDYDMALLLYLNYPKRFFSRRKPCTNIDPKCMPKCQESLTEPIVDMLDAVSFEDFFFSNIEDNHRLCVGYTIERLGDEPEYFMLDFSAQYFSDGIWDKIQWQRTIIDDKDDIYTLYDSVPGRTLDGDILKDEHFSYSGYGGTAYLVKSTISSADNVPEELQRALDAFDFHKISEFDMRSINSRNSIHKWTFNHWNEICTTSDDGWWCSWNTNEVIVDSEEKASALGDDSSQVSSQINQVANIMGWGANADESETDTVYRLVYPIYAGYSASIQKEPLSSRSVKMF